MIFDLVGRLIANSQFTCIAASSAACCCAAAPECPRTVSSEKRPLKLLLDDGVARGYLTRLSLLPGDGNVRFAAVKTEESVVKMEDEDDCDLPDVHVSKLVQTLGQTWWHHGVT